MKKTKNNKRKTVPITQSGYEGVRAIGEYSGRVMGDLIKSAPRIGIDGISLAISSALFGERNAVSKIIHYLARRPGVYWQSRGDPFSSAIVGVTGSGRAVVVQLKNPTVKKPHPLGFKVASMGGVYVQARNVADVIKAGL